MFTEIQHNESCIYVKTFSQVRKALTLDTHKKDKNTSLNSGEGQVKAEQ